MVILSDSPRAQNVILGNNHLDFFTEIQRDVVGIFKKLDDKHYLRSLYIDVSKVLFNYHEKERLQGNYSFTYEEDQLFEKLYKLIGYTRSISFGLQQRDKTYAQIMAWWNYYPECAYNAIKQLVQDSRFGYWGDIKHFCHFVDVNWYKYNNFCNDEDDSCWITNWHRDNYRLVESAHPLIKYAIEIMAKQLQNDIRILCIEDSEDKFKQISNAAKWVPGENSKSFGWIYKMLAFTYNKLIYKDASFYYLTHKQRNVVFSKFRKNIVSRLNKFIDPPQIKQCSNEWHKIDFSKVSSQTCKKFFNSFANLTTDKRSRCPYNTHRIECRKNFMEHNSAKLQKNFEMFNGSGENLINENSTDYDLLNLIISKTTHHYAINTGILYNMNHNAHFSNHEFKRQFMNHWYRDNDYRGLKNIIPVIDLNLNYPRGGSNHALYPATLIFALGARIIENMQFAKGCYIYFTEYSTDLYKDRAVWFDASNCNDVYDIVKGLINIYNKKSLNIDYTPKTFSLETIYDDIYDKIRQSNMKSDENKYKLLFLSTQGFTDSEMEMKNNMETKFYRDYEFIMNPIRRKFSNANIELPSMVYWNLLNYDYRCGLDFENSYPKIITTENHDRGIDNCHLNKRKSLFVRPELSQISYNIIKDVMSLREKHRLDSFIQGFYKDGIGGIKFFNEVSDFYTTVSNHHYDKMETIFL